MVDYTKDSILTLKIDSNVVVKNYLYENETEINVFPEIINRLFRNKSNLEARVSQTVDGKIDIPIFDRYISCTFVTCSGLGNQMFRFASLYGIGRHFNRSAFFPASNRCQKNTMPEIKATFPNFFNTIKLLNAVPKESIKSDFALDCCRYQNPNTMHDVQQKYLILNGNFMQSFKFFDYRKNDIRYFFDFDMKVKKAVEENGKKLFGNDSSHKLCVHIRRGDFIQHEQLESRAEFVEPSIPFLHKNLTQKGISNISLILLGTDHAFIKNLKFNQSNFKSIYHPILKSRGEDMHFGIQYCNSLLITASGSTFAWWIGYLMPEGSQIFYNGQIGKNRTYSKDFYDFDMFPSNWNMLELNRSTKTIQLDNRWHYERFAWPRKGIPPLIG
uniref:L-Fucosyltransferase n=1 Tax=Panagrolaimus sp. PS1159 TaxID=55785 RepID=A0AC35ETF9_9BILA